MSKMPESLATDSASLLKSYRKLRMMSTERPCLDSSTASYFTQTGFKTECASGMNSLVSFCSCYNRDSLKLYLYRPTYIEGLIIIFYIKPTAVISKL